MIVADPDGNECTSPTPHCRAHDHHSPATRARAGAPFFKPGFHPRWHPLGALPAGQAVDRFSRFADGGGLLAASITGVFLGRYLLAGFLRPHSVVSLTLIELLDADSLQPRSGQRRESPPPVSVSRGPCEMEPLMLRPSRSIDQKTGYLVGAVDLQGCNSGSPR